MIWDSPIAIGNIFIKNRIVFPPITGNWALVDGSVSEQILKFYQELAEGGCGMIIVSGTAVSPEGKATDRSLCIFNKNHLSGLRVLAEKIKTSGCFSSIQLSHAGGQANPEFTGYKPVSPSGTTCCATGFDSRKLEKCEIEEIREKFIFSARLAALAGFHAVELHLAHGYLLHQFLSEYTNKRTDEYGGSIENRLKLVMEIIAGIKKTVPDLLIGVRVSGEDYIEGGINKKVNSNILPRLEGYGICYFSVTAGIYETSRNKHEAMKKGEFFKYSKEIKSMVSKPVIGVGKILNIEAAEERLKDNCCDMVAIGRGLMADPMMINKIKNNEEFVRCTECDKCHYLRFGEKNMNCPLRN